MAARGYLVQAFRYQSKKKSGTDYVVAEKGFAVDKRIDQHQVNRQPIIKMAIVTAAVKHVLPE